LSLISPFPSYHCIPPLENGGVIARNGFEFQDHVAAGYCIDMIMDINLCEVWCESLDDITLVRQIGEQEEFEFVQAKSNNLGHLWSVAELCKRDKKTKIPVIGSSILEKSLAYDRGKEPCYFRIVTCVGVNDDLKILELPLNSPNRTSTTNIIFADLCSKVSGKIPNYQSSKGNNTSFWLSKAVWEVCHSAEALENANIIKLMDVGGSLNLFLAKDQWDELYKKILRKVQDAGKAKWEVNVEAKKIKKDCFFTWIKDLVDKAQHPGIGSTAGGEQLSVKMTAAGIPSDSIRNAQEQRRFYRQQALSGGYLNLSKREELEMNTQAQLHQLISHLDAGKLNDTGVEFHSRCLDLLDKVHRDEGVELWFLQGFMYYIANRCVHRFKRVEI
jgi:hypothetical protein